MKEKTLMETITEKVQANIEERITDVTEQVMDKMCGVYWNTAQQSIYDKVADIFAKRFVEENYGVLSEKIDLNRVAKMSELAAVGKLSRGE